jgi:hypothetical protein
MTETEATLEPRRPVEGGHAANLGEWTPAEVAAPAQRRFEVASLIALVVVQITWVLLLGYLVGRVLDTSLFP